MEASLIILLFAIGCAAGPRSTPLQDVSPTRYSVGDRVVYRYSGTTMSSPVVLTELIVAQEGNHLEIEVTAVRGDETRRWIQVLTDTPENQRNDVIDELYEVVDGQRHQLANEANRDIMRMYEWTLPPMEGELEFEQNEEVTVEIAGQQYACTRESSRSLIAGRHARFIRHSCPEFLWTNGPSAFRDLETDEVLWQMEVIESDGGF